MTTESEDVTNIPKPPPAHLGMPGREFWTEVLAEFNLNSAERRILADAASEVDMVSYLESSWIADGRPTTTYGSKNQLVSHPAVQELRQHRTVLRQLIVSLRLPSAEADSGLVGLLEW